MLAPDPSPGTLARVRSGVLAYGVAAHVSDTQIWTRYSGPEAVVSPAGPQGCTGQPCATGQKGEDCVLHFPI